MFFVGAQVLVELFFVLDAIEVEFMRVVHPVLGRIEVGDTLVCVNRIEIHEVGFWPFPAYWL